MTPATDLADPSMLAGFRRASRLASALTMAIAAIAMIGWVLGIEPMKRLAWGRAPMAPEAALALAIAGASLWLLQEGAGPRQHRIGRWLAGVAALLGLFRLAELLGWWEAGPGEILFPMWTERSQMAPNTAFAVACLGGALALLDGTARRSQVLALASGLVAFLVLLGYLYSTAALVGVATYIPMALNSAIALMLLALGVLFARPTRGIMAVFASEGMGGLIARTLLPVVVLLPIGLAYLRLVGEAAGYYGPAAGVALMTAATSIVAGGVVWWSAAMLARQDRRRREVEEALRRAKDELEYRVEERTAELAASEALEGAILAASLDAIVVMDHEGVVVEWNAGAERTFGYARDEAIGKTVAELIVPPPLREAHWRGLARYMASGEGPVIRRLIELPAMRKDGSEFPAEVFIAPIERAARPTFAGFIRDISQRRAAEAAIAEALGREQEARAEAEEAVQRTAFLAEAGLLLSSSLDYEETLRRLADLAVPRIADWCAVAMREDGQIRQLAVVHVDPAKVRLARELQARFPPDPDAPYGLANVLRTGRPELSPEIPGEVLERLHPDQRRILEGLGLVSYMIVPIVVRGEAVGALTLVTAESGRRFDQADLTLAEELARRAASAIESAQLYRDLQAMTSELDRRVRDRTIQLEALNKELEAFAYSVSHDLRAPLRAIDGFSMALLEDYEAQLDDVGKDYLRRVRAASQRMAQLIEDILKLSRLTRGEMKWEPTDMSAIAHGVSDEFRQIEPHRRVDVQIEEAVVVDGDPRLLRVVLENLLSNAWKFTGKRDEGRIEFGMREEGGETVYFVRDNGAGFDMAYADKLFKPFQRLHAAAEFPGTGIGLATVQRIINRHGGRIWAEGAVDQGATFSFTLGAAPRGAQKR